MGNKTKTVQTPYQNNSSSWVDNSPDIDAARASVNDNINDIISPVQQAQYSLGRQKAQNRINSAYNEATPAHLRVAQQNAVDRNMLADQGLALAQGAFDQNQAAFQRKMALAGLTAKRQQTGSGYGSQVVQQPSIWGSIIQGGAGVASTAILA